ncbi:glycosyltransferase [Methylobacterium sp. 092160098-2]|uniref:glycosyltransferase n=1 Tax=Methylobacterium sp. 092160098-2 TaxID=3025129 RepID=UPI002381A35C|nr:glycosyltransferase [Methylobacterium sp. 092160098-2]MDE4915347.1 glycosyltransferase [Methylobacterium sp. 092160098-2]
MSICIVTFEAIGFWRNGGIATVSTGLAELLAAEGHRVTLALTRADMLAPEVFKAESVRYEKQGIEVVPISRMRVGQLEGPLADFTSWERYAVYDWLRGRSFDVVHTSEHLGEAYYCLVAKKLGLAFHRTQFWVGCHGPSAWVIEANEELASHSFWMWTDAAERFVLREADLVWTPSRYLVAWMRCRGFELPSERLFQQTYYIPDDLGVLRNRERPKAEHTSELIFFGRLEPRKGIKLFVDAVLALKNNLSGILITFMGRQSTVDGVPASDYIAARLSDSGLIWQILDSFDREKAYDYVIAPGRVAVLASPVDNSPCAVYELLEIGARFVACAGGGIPELLDPSSHPEVLFSYTVESLTERLSEVIAQAPALPKAAPYLERSDTVAAWVAAHATVAAELAERFPAKSPPAHESLTIAIIVDGDCAALHVSAAAIRWLGTLVSDFVLVVADTRSVLASDILPGIERLSFDELDNKMMMRSLNRGGRPVVLLRSGAVLTPEGCSRLLNAISGNDAVVPFSFRAQGDGSQVTEPVLAGDWAWTALYGAAPVGGVISAEALELLAKSEFVTGTNPLLWFDAAVLHGLSVLSLAEPLIEATSVNRLACAQMDMRARQIACMKRLAPGQRIAYEVGISALLQK